MHRSTFLSTFKMSPLGSLPSRDSCWALGAGAGEDLLQARLSTRQLGGLWLTQHAGQVQWACRTGTRPGEGLAEGEGEPEAPGEGRAPLPSLGPGASAGRGCASTCLSLPLGCPLPAPLGALQEEGPVPGLVSPVWKGPWVSGHAPACSQSRV